MILGLKSAIVKAREIIKKINEARIKSLEQQVAIYEAECKECISDDAKNEIKRIKDEEVGEIRKIVGYKEKVVLKPAPYQLRLF